MTQSFRSKLVTRRTYNRPLDESGQVFETWDQTIDRVLSHQKWLWERAQGKSLSSAQHIELTELGMIMRHRGGSVSGRTLWLGGTEVSRTREASQFNCAFSEVSTVYNIVDSLWLLLQGCGVGFRPKQGILNGFTRPTEIEIVRSKRGPNEKGRPHNTEHVRDGVWYLSVGDSAEAWAKGVGKILVQKVPVAKMVIDLREIRGAGGRLAGYGWISSGDEQLYKAIEAICAIMNTRVGQLLTSIDIMDIMNWLGTVLSSRRSAEIALMHYGHPESEEFMYAKSDLATNPQRTQSNNSQLFWSKPSKMELKGLFQAMVDSGGSEPGLINAYGAALRAPWFAGVNPCVTGDTIIATVDGPKSFEELASTEEDVLVYSWDPKSKKPVVKTMRRPHKTGLDRELVQVEFDSGLKVRCTLNHGFFSFRGNKVRADELKVGQSVRAWSMSQHRDGHLRVHGWDSNRNVAVHQWVHRMVWEETNGAVQDGDVVHHKDHNPLNNTIDNLECISSYEHQSHHYPERFANGFDGTCKNHKVVSVKPAGFEDVYNGCVDDSHTYIILDPDPVAGISSGIVSANCGEILLGNNSFCNLVENNIASGTKGEIYRRHYLLARANYRQTCVNLRDGVLSSSWHELNEFLRLCGVGVTGVVGSSFTAADYRELRRLAQTGANSMADELGLPRAKLVTTVKPSGTLSKVMDCPEGAHKPLGRYILNNINFSQNDPLVNKLIAAGYDYRENPYDSTGILVKVPASYDTTSFDEVDGVPVNTESATTQLERYKFLMENYVDHNCSITVSYSKDELPSMIDWMHANWDSYVGVSFLFRNDPTKTAEDLGYAYLPQEVVDGETFTNYTSRLKEVNLDSDFGDMLDFGECEGGVCPVR